MLILNKFILIKVLPTLIIFSCAVQGPATGGPIDKTGPQLVAVEPINNSTNISTDQNITLTFNELLDPISVPYSINIQDQQEYRLKIKGRKVVISPLNKWKHDEPLRIDISRRVRDFQKNLMSSPIQLIFSPNLQIPSGKIRGNIKGIIKNKLVEIGLYRWPIYDSLILMQKVEANDKGDFIFNSVSNGKYTIIALEGILNNVKSQINKKRYSVSTSNFLNITTNNNLEKLDLILSEPIERMRITSIDMESQYSSIITMDNNDKEIYVIDSTLSVGDSVYINLSKTNRVESYQIPEYSFILPLITDTLAPYLESSYFEDQNFIINFSEPVEVKEDAIIFFNDSLLKPLSFKYESPISITIQNFSNSIKEIQIRGSKIFDWSQNSFLDSNKTVSTIRNNREKVKVFGGNIFGKVIYNEEYPIKIEAQNINSKQNYITTVVNNEFEIVNLEPGLYTLWAFEAINYMNRDIYHSGSLQPFHRSAKFSFYLDTIDVRARWDIENINIKFDE